MPPVLAMVGSREALSDDARRIVDGIRAKGGVARLSLYEDMPHVWTFFSSFLPEGELAIDEAGEFLRRHCASAV
jgi:acetyl esterase/lipase